MMLLATWQNRFFPFKNVSDLDRRDTCLGDRPATAAASVETNLDSL